MDNITAFILIIAIVGVMVELVWILGLYSRIDEEKKKNKISDLEYDIIRALRKAQYYFNFVNDLQDRIREMKKTEGENKG